MSKQAAHYAWGLRAEWRAAWYFRIRFYKILAKRFKTKVGEIDLIVARGNKIHFVEVKGRSDFDKALHSLTPVAQKRIARAAELFIQKNPDYKNATFQFDFVGVTPRLKVIYVPHIWQPYT
jgi:putative endonuclease